MSCRPISPVPTATQSQFRPESIPRPRASQAFLSAEEIAAWRAPSAGDVDPDLRRPLRQALSQHGQLDAGQTAGRFYPIACVALEVTQKCNLDCTLCYLSDHAEMAHDMPLEVLFRRIDTIERQYGAKTPVQLTGGDPTLRSPEHLERLCRYIRERGMRSCLMTNGIKATDTLLQRLAKAGLDDVAFHVDLTQDRRGYPTEVSLDPVRQTYIERAQKAGLRILFNTTVFEGNIEEMPAVAAFFRRNAAYVTLASFQMEAITGRGLVRKHTSGLTRERVTSLLDAGLGTRVNYDVASVGHASCTRYGAVLVAGDIAVSALDNSSLFVALLSRMEKHAVFEAATIRVAPTVCKILFRDPVFALRLTAHLITRLWLLRRGLLTSGGRVHRMSLLLHNFMDARELERDRCESCVFMVATERGLVSMCVHNARRDADIFAPVRIDTKDGPKWWSASTGRTSATPDDSQPEKMPFKRLKGRLRAKAEAGRKKCKTAT